MLLSTVPSRKQQQRQQHDVPCNTSRVLQAFKCETVKLNLFFVPHNVKPMVEHHEHLIEDHYWK